MPDITKGVTYSSGDTLTAASLNSLIDDATINDGVVTTSKLATGAVSTAKMAALADGRIIIGTGSGVGSFAVSGDATMSNAGVMTIAPTAVEGSMLNANTVDDSTLQLSASKLQVKSEGISTSELAAAVSNALCPAGSMMPYAGATAPGGWLLCDGQWYDSTGSYAALYAVLGYTYGQTDSGGTLSGSGTYFKVPDMRGRVAVCADNISSLGDAGVLSANETRGSTGGSEKIGLAEANLPSHTHANTVSNNETTSTVSDNSTTDDYGTPWSHDSTDVQVIPNDPYSPHDSWRKAEIWDGGSWDVQPEHSNGVGRPYLNMRADKNWNHYFEVKNTSNVSISNAAVGSGTQFNVTQPYAVTTYIIKT